MNKEQEAHLARHLREIELIVMLNRAAKLARQVGTHVNGLERQRLLALACSMDAEARVQGQKEGLCCASPR